MSRNVDRRQTLDLWALLHEDGRQKGMAVGYTRQGLKPCPRPLIPWLTEVMLIANYWLRFGNTACVNGAAEFLRVTVQSLPAHQDIDYLPEPIRQAEGRHRASRILTVSVVQSSS